MKKLLVLSVTLLTLSPALLEAATIPVNSALDTAANDGLCTLREAITAANANAASGAASGECPAGDATDLISFAIGSGQQTISPASALPNITGDNITIDGGTQPGFSGLPLIELNGIGVAAPSTFGLFVLGDSVVIRGLAINRFTGSGITIAGATADAVVEGNFLGTDVTGTIDLGNGSHGISVGGPNNRIGGSAPGAFNVISGNAGCGIHLVGSESVGNVVEGNFIGTALGGAAALPNDFCGIVINNGADDNSIGGASSAQRNVISGNDGNGIDIGGGIAGTNGNLIQGNFVGTDATGALALPNTGAGVLIREDALDNAIGGTAAGEGNLIAFNLDRGVGLLDTAAPGTRILGNSIHSNGQFGIDLGFDGVTANDVGDVDSGPNNLQNFPILSLASASAGDVTLEGSLNGQADTDFRLELFASSACDDSGNGEGQILLGSVDVTTDGGGNAIFSQTLALPSGTFFTATATDLVTGDSSEFSPCLAGSGLPTPTPSAIPTPSATPSASATPNPPGVNPGLSGGGCSLGQTASGLGSWPAALLVAWGLLRRRAK